MTCYDLLRAFKLEIDRLLAGPIISADIFAF